MVHDYTKRILCVILFTPHMERLSVSLDDKSVKLIKKYENKYETSKAAIIRKALICMDTVEENTQNVSLETIEKYVDYLATMEHIILDIAHWESVWNEIGEGSEKFWNEVYEVGMDHRVEYYDKGIREIKDVLEHVEKTNWYQLNVDSEDCFTLILAVSGSSKFVKTFFDGFFDEWAQKVEITNGKKKLRINVR